MEYGAATQGVYQTDPGRGHPPEQGVKKNEEKKKPARVKYQTKVPCFSKVHIDKLRRG
jgi:hypothetical protein